MTEEKKPFDQNKYIEQWKQANYDRIHVQIPKGEKARLQAHAKSKGEFVNNRKLSSGWPTVGADGCKNRPDPPR